MRILITAGPTREFIDPVRYISNSSTGFFGYQIARQALRRGHKVVLVSGPTHLAPPKGARFIQVVSALQMKSAVERFFRKADCLIMAAAVADYRPEKFRPSKIKKNKDSLLIRLRRNPDILSGIRKGKGIKRIIGFALETGDLIRNAQKKLDSKNLDFIVATLLCKGSEPFGDKKVKVVVLKRDGKREEIFSSKAGISSFILDKAENE